MSESNTELVGSPEAGSRLITDDDLDRAAKDVRLSLEEMLTHLPFDDPSYAPKLRSSNRRVLRETMAPMSQREEQGIRAEARGSVSARVLDRFGRCAVCGRREACCEKCHRAHDYDWTQYEATPNLAHNKIRGDAHEARERTMAQKKRADLLRQLEELGGQSEPA